MKTAASLFIVLGLVMVPLAADAGGPELRASHRTGANARVAANLPADMMATLTSTYTTKELEDDLVVVGDEYCIACHSWSAITHEVKHRKALRIPMGMNSLIAGKGVVADYDQNGVDDGVDDFMQGLDFNTISSVFDPYKPNAPILSYRAGDDRYFMTIGELKVRIEITQGGTGDWKQRYLTTIPVTGTPSGWATDQYVSPLQFNEKTHEWVAYHPEHWWDPDTKAPRFGPRPPIAEVAAVGRSYSKRCIGCHFRESMSQDGNGEWLYRPFPASLVPPDYKEQYPDYDRDGIPDIINIGCEACHGPGSAHILGGGDPDDLPAMPRSHRLGARRHLRLSLPRRCRRVLDCGAHRDARQRLLLRARRLVARWRHLETAPPAVRGPLQLVEADLRMAPGQVRRVSQPAQGRQAHGRDLDHR
jgi:mono/diheme cytochrome c family protein